MSFIKINEKQYSDIMVNSNYIKLIRKLDKPNNKKWQYGLEIILDTGVIDIGLFINEKQRDKEFNRLFKLLEA